MQTLHSLMPPTLATLSRQTTEANLWAARRLATWLSEQPHELFFQQVPSSFPTLASTLDHIRTIEGFWLANLKGWEYSFNYGQAYEGTVPDLLEGFVQAATDLDAYVQNLSEAELTADCSFKIPIRWPEFDQFERARFLVVQHVATHSYYHRGQVVTMAHALGIKGAPNTGFMGWMLTGQPS